MESTYPKRLCHGVLEWVKSGSVFHIRIRVAPAWKGSLVDESIGTALLESVRFYHDRTNWHCNVFLLMPDHLHALLSFNPSKPMSQCVSAWKAYASRTYGIEWQNNYFDHRIRHNESLDGKRQYILKNPVAKGLCKEPEDWKWVLMPK